jgi:Homeodomain-like domain
MVRGAPVLMVDSDPDRVELALAAGELACARPGCGGVLGPWGWARGRWLRDRGGVQQRVRPRRGRCRERACRATHVLLPTVGLLRRVDLVEVIGAALLARARQASLRQVAAELGVPLSTVRGWLDRMTGERAELVRAHFTRLAVWLDPSVEAPQPRGSPLADVVEAIGIAAVAAARRLGSTGPASAPSGPWRLAAGATGGRLLAPLALGAGNTSSLFPAPW